MNCEILIPAKGASCDFTHILIHVQLGIYSNLNNQISSLILETLVFNILKNTDSRFKSCRKKQFDDFKWFIQFFFYIKWLPVTNNWCTNMYQHFHRKYFNLIDLNTITCNGASKFANKYKQVDNMIPLKGVHSSLEILSLIHSHLQQFWYHEWKCCPISRCPCW